MQVDSGLRPVGVYTKQEENEWDEARKTPLFRLQKSASYEGRLVRRLKRMELERGVNYFVLALERLGCRTHFSCEGHPNDFYIVFSCNYETAIFIASLGYFNVELNERDNWSLRKAYDAEDKVFDAPEVRGLEEAEVYRRRHVDAMRWAAQAWEEGINSYLKGKENVCQGSEL